VTGEAPAAPPVHRLAGAGRRAARLGPRVAAWGPLTVAVVAGGAALAFVVLRLLLAADGDITRFVVAGRTFVEPGHGVHVFGSSGYDGQFYWRLAVDPAEWSRHAHGVTFDNAYRPPRIGYPLLAHVVAGGQAGLVPYSLVAVNVVAVAAVAGVAGRLAADTGHAPAYGLLVAAAPGLVMPLGRDLAECVTVACLLGGVLALCRGRWGVATACWAYAVLTREQALVTVVAYAVWRSAPPIRRAVLPAISRPARAGATVGTAGAPPAPVGPTPASPTPGAPPAVTLPTTAPAGAADVPWVVPLLVFAGWQLVLWRSTGGLPAASAGESNLVPPFTALVPGVAAWATGDLPRLHAAAPLQLATVVALSVAAAGRARTIPADLGYAVVALAMAIVAATCLAGSIWRDPSDMRHLVDVSTWSTLVLVVAAKAPARWVVILVATTWVATAAVRVLAP
jgi:hypothetical protein